MEMAAADTRSRIADRDDSRGQRDRGQERTSGGCLLLALPDELLLTVLGALAHPEVAGRVAPVSRRLHDLSRDDALWQDLYRRRYGPPVHRYFVDNGKDWRWLYQARSQCGVVDSSGPGCVAVKPEGRFYCGDLQQGVPHGYGLRVWIKGADAATRADPRRAFTLPGDARREGTWACGKRHGRTIHTFADGDRYEGECANDLRHGHGTYTRPGAFTYRGTYARGKRNGWGVMCHHRSGRRYEGRWEHGQRGGQGTLFMSDGRSHRGQWRSGTPCGWGVHTWPNGQRVEGTWNGGSAPRGQAVLIAADGRCFVDDAQEVFCVGGVAVPDGIDFGGRIKRMDKGPANDPAQPLTFDALYLDGSRLLVGCPTVDQSGSHRVTAHSGACALVAMAGDQDKGATGT
ncbi:morn repeat incomplete domain containing protein [Pandoravirus japonicus]|uniref:Morn repeat incomplete domain containing protein n=1 Tax=Pandoravirus japonicus TaxID=2823154 RepID=A0A811BSC2_9VIRU|nr:morn repeat incomplete domain containing protein [Pandoravirus japonicus]